MIYVIILESIIHFNYIWSIHSSTVGLFSLVNEVSESILKKGFCSLVNIWFLIFIKWKNGQYFFIKKLSDVIALKTAIIMGFYF